MRTLFKLLRRLLLAALLLAATLVGFDVYQLKTQQLPCQMTLWDKRYRSLEVELLDVGRTQLRVLRLADGKYFTIPTDTLSWLSRGRLRLLQAPAPEQSAAAPASGATARLLEERGEQLQQIQYFQARAELTTSKVEARTLQGKIQRAQEHLLEIEQRLVELGVELNYTTAKERDKTEPFNNMGKLLERFSKF